MPRPFNRTPLVSRGGVAMESRAPRARFPGPTARPGPAQDPTQMEPDAAGMSVDFGLNGSFFLSPRPGKNGKGERKRCRCRFCSWHPMFDAFLWWVLHSKKSSTRRKVLFFYQSHREMAVGGWAEPGMCGSMFFGALAWYPHGLSAQRAEGRRPFSMPRPRPRNDWQAAAWHRASSFLPCSCLVLKLKASRSIYQGHIFSSPSCCMLKACQVTFPKAWPACLARASS